MALSILAAPMSVEQLSLISLPPKEQEQSEYDDSLNLLRNKYGVDIGGICSLVDDKPVRETFVNAMKEILEKKTLNDLSVSLQIGDKINVFVSQLISMFVGLGLTHQELIVHVEFLPLWIKDIFGVDGGENTIVDDDLLGLYWGGYDRYCQGGYVHETQGNEQLLKQLQNTSEGIQNTSEGIQNTSKGVENASENIVEKRRSIQKGQEIIADEFDNLRDDPEIKSFFSSLDRDEKFKDFVESSRPFFKDVPFMNRLSFERYMQLVYFLDQVELGEVTIIDEKVREQIGGLDRLLVGVERRMGIVRPRLTYESIEYVEGADSGSLATIGQPEVFSMVQVPSGANIFEHVEDTYQDEIFGDESEYLQSLGVEEVEMLDLYPPIIKVGVDGERQGTLWMTMGGVLVDFGEGKYRVGV